MFTGEIIVGIEVVRKNIHAESTQDTYQFLGYFSRADDACCFPYISTQKSVQRNFRRVRRVARGILRLRITSGQQYILLRHKGNKQGRALR